MEVSQRTLCGAPERLKPYQPPLSFTVMRLEGANRGPLLNVAHGLGLCPRPRTSDARGHPSFEASEAKRAHVRVARELKSEN